MKRFLSIALGLSLFASFFSACGEEESSNDPAALSTHTETLEGQFKPIGNAGVNFGVDVDITDFFEAEDGTTYYAYSNNLDLSDPKYKNTDLEVYGEISYYENVSKGIFEVRMITPLAPDTDDGDEDINESENKEYSSESLNLSFTYPADWILSEYGDTVRLDAPEDGSAGDSYIMIADLGAVLSPEAADIPSAVQNYISLYYPHLVGITSNTTTIGQDFETAVHFSASSGSEIYLVPQESHLYEISLYSGNGYPNSVSQDVFSEVLAGFQFINSLSTEDPSSKDPLSIDEYQRFESDYLGFNMLYPYTYYYQGDSAGYTLYNGNPETNGEEVFRLDLASSGVEGEISFSVGTLSITQKKGDLYFTMQGPSDMKEVMETMLDSITLTNP